MIKYWKALSGNTKFSLLGFFIVAGLGLLSMGLLGLLLYYPVAFLLSSFPAFNDWHGDWVWPVLIGVGMFWSIGFILAGITVHFFKRVNESIINSASTLYAYFMAVGCHLMVHCFIESELGIKN
jgi:hypothetical protein